MDMLCMQQKPLNKAPHPLLVHKADLRDFNNMNDDLHQTARAKARKTILQPVTHDS
jgi:hypothetical protein